LPTELEEQVISFVHTALEHLGTEKCMSQIAHTFCVKNLDRKVRRFVSSSDVCQRIKHPNRNYEVESKSHMPERPGELCAIDLYGPLPPGRAGVRYIMVCLDMFSKFVELYALRSATTKACLHKIATNYVVDIVRPDCILSDNGTQFSSPFWRKKLAELGVKVKYTPIRRPQSNPSERVMREIGKFCKIYCNKSHKIWPELLSEIERWLNGTVSDSTG
jgi:transposase InsO family protein